MEAAALLAAEASDTRCPSCSGGGSTGGALVLHAHPLGTVLRCPRCSGSTAEPVLEASAARVALLSPRWELPARQELVLVTLDCDRPPLQSKSEGSKATGKQAGTSASSSGGAGASSVGGLAHHVFTAAELAHDPLSSLHFVSSFDVFECSQVASALAPAETLPPDVVDMILALDDAQGTNAHEAAAAADAEAAAAESSRSRAVPAMAGEDEDAAMRDSKQHLVGSDDADSAATEELTEEQRVLASRHTLARTLSELMKKAADTEAGGASTTTANQSGAAAPAGALQSSRSSLSGAAAFASVREDTLSDLEASSDVSRAASSAMNASMAACPSVAGAPAKATSHLARTASSSSDAPPPLIPYKPAGAAAAAVDAAPAGLIDSAAPAAASPAPSAAPVAAVDVERQLAEFVGVPLPSPDAPLATSLPPLSGLLPSPPASQDLPPGLGAFDAPVALDPSVNGGGGAGLLERGLSSAVDAFVLQSDLAVQSEAPAGTLARSYSLLHQRIDSDLRGIGAGVATGGAAAGGGGGDATAAAAAAASSDLTRGFSLLGGGSQEQQPLASRLDSGLFGAPQPSGLISPSLSFTAAAAQQQYQLSRLPSLAGSGWAEQRAASSSQHQQLLRRTSSFGRITGSAVGAAVLQPLIHSTFMQQYNEDLRQLQQRTESHVVPSGAVEQRMLESPVPFGSEGASYSFVAPAGAPGTGVYSQLSMTGSPPRMQRGSGSQMHHSQSQSQEDTFDFDASAPQVGHVGRLASYDYQPQQDQRIMDSQAQTQSQSDSQSQAPNQSVTPVPRAGHSPAVRGRLDATTVARLSRGSVAALAPAEAAGAASAERISRLLYFLRLSATLREHLEDFCARLGTDNVTAGLAGHIAREMQVRKLSASRESASICVTALYAAYKLRGVIPLHQGRAMTQKTFCAALGKTEVTMRKILYMDIAPNWFLLVPEKFEPRHLPPEFAPRPPQPKLSANAGRPKRLDIGEEPPPVRSASSVLHALHGDAKMRVMQGEQAEEEAAAQLQQPQQQQLQVASQPLEGEVMGPPAPRRPSLQHRLSSRRSSHLAGAGMPGSPASLSSASTPLSMHAPSRVPPGFVLLQGALRTTGGNTVPGSAGVLRFVSPLPYTPDGQSRIHVTLKPSTADGDAAGEGLQSPGSPPLARMAAAAAARRIRRTNLPREAREANSDSSTDEEGEGSAADVWQQESRARTGHASYNGLPPPPKRARPLLVAAPHDVPVEFGRPKAVHVMSQSKFTKAIMAEPKLYAIKPADADK